MEIKLGTPVERLSVCLVVFLKPTHGATVILTTADDRRVDPLAKWWLLLPSFGRKLATDFVYADTGQQHEDIRKHGAS